MPLLTPQFDFRRIQEIPTSFFAQHGIRALLLDVDNTLTGDNSQEVKPEVAGSSRPACGCLSSPIIVRRG